MAYLWIVVTRENAIEILVMAMTSTKMKRLNCSASTFEFNGKTAKMSFVREMRLSIYFYACKNYNWSDSTMKSTGSRIECHRRSVQWMDGFDFAFSHVQHFLRTHTHTQWIGCLLMKSFLIGIVIGKKSLLIRPSHLPKNDQMTIEHAIKLHSFRELDTPIWLIGCLSFDSIRNFSILCWQRMTTHGHTISANNYPAKSGRYSR